MVVREKNCYYAIALTDFFVFLSCAEKLLLLLSVTKSLKLKQPAVSRCTRNKARPKSAYPQIQG